MHKIAAFLLGIMFFAGALLAGTDKVGISPPEGQRAIDNLLAGRFKWTVSSPLVYPAERLTDLVYSVKDPTIVYFKGRWHLFCTIRGQARSHQIEYICFDDWKNIDAAKRYILTLTKGYFCAPQVFYFAPHKRWYLIYQTGDQTRKPSLQPAYSTSRDISDPSLWTEPTLLFQQQPDNVKMWIDFWVICDSTRAHLFFTSLDGQMWRSETKLSDFPRGWSKPAVVLRGDIFEASHTYYLKGLNKFMTIVEAQADGRRYYKAYLAETLDGEWNPLAATKNKPFAGPINTIDTATHWTDSFSHGELIRDGYDQTLTVDPNNIRFLFQGVSDQNMAGKKYGEIPWRLGMLTPAK